MLVVAAGDVDEHLLGGLEVEVIEQRRLEGGLDRLLDAVGTGADSAAHQGHSAVFHHRLHILEVHVDVAALLDDLDDAPDGGGEHLVRLRESILYQLVAVVFVQLLVVDKQQAVHVLLQLVHAVDGSRERLVALVEEGECHNGHSQDALVLGHLGNHRSGSGARAAAHTGGDEEHLGAGIEDYLFDLVLALQGGVAAHDRVGAGAESAPELDLGRHRTAIKRLRISVAHCECAALDALAEHIVDRVAASSSDAEDLDDFIRCHPVVGGDCVNH